MCELLSQKLVVADLSPQDTHQCAKMLGERLTKISRDPHTLAELLNYQIVWRERFEDYAGVAQE